MTEDNIKKNISTIQEVFLNYKIKTNLKSHTVGHHFTEYIFRFDKFITDRMLKVLEKNLSLTLPEQYPIRIYIRNYRKPLITIETTNINENRVGINKVLSSEEFKSFKNNLTVPLGIDKNNKPIFKELNKIGSFFTAGHTGSGKSNFLHSIIFSLLAKNPSEKDLQFLLIDPKRIEFHYYKNLPHLYSPIIFKPKEAKEKLELLYKEIHRRFDIFGKAKKQSIKSYNKYSKEKIPYIICLVDEMSDLMVSYPKIGEYIKEIMWFGRYSGIYIIGATSRPSKDIYTDTMMGNSITKASFQYGGKANTYWGDYFPNANNLIGMGDMLFSDIDNITPIRLRTFCADTNHIKKFVEQYKK